MSKNAANLLAPHFIDKDAAREYLEAQVWPEGKQVCPHCSVVGEHYKLTGKSARPGLYKCKDCRSPFSVTVGSIFEASKIPLNKWLMAVHLLCSSKKGMSSHQLHRMLGITYKSAWFMTHRIREAMSSTGGMFGMGGEPVEVDETYWGQLKSEPKKRGGASHKMKIVSLVERGGEKRTHVVPNVTSANLRPIMKAQISEKARLMTDEHYAYIKIGREFASHEVVNHHSGEYARGDATTNTVESSFAILKRGLYGTFHHVSEQHLQRYATEFDFRWNTRTKLGFTDLMRAEKALQSIHGKRLTYRRTDSLAPALNG